VECICVRPVRIPFARVGLPGRSSEREIGEPRAYRPSATAQNGAHRLKVQHQAVRYLCNLLCEKRPVNARLPDVVDGVAGSRAAGWLSDYLRRFFFASQVAGS